MVDPVGQIIEVWQQDADTATFVRLGVYSDGDSFTSLALSKTISLKNIFV
ncbi:MAG: hypothetical protein AAF126_18235 [Chloroflexota bacterium]